MKSFRILFTVVVMTTTVCHAQEPQSFTEDFRNAIRSGAKIMFTVKIVDDLGNPVTNAAIVTSFHRAKDTAILFQGLSDSNGMCVVDGVSTRSMLGTVLKDRYYTSTFQFMPGDFNILDYGGSSSKVYYDSKVKDGRWLPWNPTIPVILKKIREPVHMIHSRKDVKIPQFDKHLEFDLEKGDWVAPNGGGRIPDMVVRFEKVNEDTPFRMITVEFPGSMNGAYLQRKDDYSVLKSIYRASPDAPYAQRIENANSVRGPVHVLLGSGDYLVFRARSVIDENGNLVAAHYGKIYGPLDYYVMARNKLRLIYYFNPNINDTNLEFDGRSWGEQWGR